MSVQIYYKATIWCKLEFDILADPNKIIEMLENNCDMNDLICKPDLHFNYDEYMADTEEILSLEENNNQCTIEVLKNNHKLWDNVDGLIKEENDNR